MAGHALPGSERQLPRGARAVGNADPTEHCQVSVVLRRTAGTLPEHHLTREDFARTFSAPPADVAAVRSFAAANRLAVAQANAARGTVVLSGPVAAFNAAFGVTMQRVEHAGGVFRGRTGSVSVPDALRNSTVAVLGLDNRPVARPHVRHRSASGRASAAGDSFDPRIVAYLYDFPPGNGAGECIGLIELGGGYRNSDLQAYFSGLGISPEPNVTFVSVDGATNAPTGDPNGPDSEVMLDIEVAGAIAPGAKIIVYFAPNTDAGFLDALTTAVHDTVNRPSVISISWGAPEADWTMQAIAAFDAALAAAAAMGITVCVSSGDDGSSDGATDGADHVDFPASSLHVLACGGTRLLTRGGAITGETAWNDGLNGGATGGGISSFFAVPPWQAGLRVTTLGQAGTLQMRGIPDVSGNADPETGYAIRVDGTQVVVGGTSAVAPLWAGLIARINAGKGRSVGLVNPLLYRAPGALRDVAQGTNGTYDATAGWDACTGLGSPNGLQAALVLEAALAS
ncbi:MAG TPA: S53 family peptidase [Acetobacteraceae bacterium]|jgi:kumamolisin|nr:S53 family peptidase [Acetobacteraceae bacterium]